MATNEQHETATTSPVDWTEATTRGARRAAPGASEAWIVAVAALAAMDFADAADAEDEDEDEDEDEGGLQPTEPEAERWGFEFAARIADLSVELS